MLNWIVWNRTVFLFTVYKLKTAFKQMIVYKQNTLYLG